MGVGVGGHGPTNFSYRPKDAPKNFTSFDTNVADREKMVSNEKLTKNRELRGLKLRGLTRNQISTPHFIYQNDHRYKINISGDFENEITTHIGAAHAISKVEQNF